MSVQNLILWAKSGDVRFIILSVVLAILAVPAVTRLVTTVRFHASLRYFRNAAGAKSLAPRLPPLVPYNIPILGHALIFIDSTPGRFHRRMQEHFSANPHIGCVSVLLAGQRAHVLADAGIVQRLFKARGLTREQFTRDIMVKGNGLSEEDDLKAHVTQHPDGLTTRARNEDMNSKYLLRQQAVNVLTTEFMENFQRQLKLKVETALPDTSSSKEIALYLFIRDNMFTASTTAVFGTEIFKHIPDIDKLFWPFSDGLLERLIQLGKRAAPEAYSSLDTLLDKWEQWNKYVDAERMYTKLGLGPRGRASFDMGFMFALNSNAIPAASWMICHLLQPHNAELLAHVRAEIDRARSPSSGSIDIAALLNDCAYLNSCLHETMRCYVDVLITRTLSEDHTLDHYILNKGDIIIAPAYLSHHDPRFWSSRSSSKGTAATAATTGPPPENVWFGERFLKHDPATGQVTFSTAGTGGKFFPFGGGTYLCPGRVFAKQEVFGSIAAFLSLFDVEFVDQD
ncbi:hypothetical protein DV738_g4348, partial [Chaetothyriales sp. CBS 135597]